MDFNHHPVGSENTSELQKNDRKLQRTMSNGSESFPGDQGSHLPVSADEAPPPTVPVAALDAVFEFLDGNGLLSCETVSYRWRLATDRTHLWKRACLSAFPHLADECFDSAYVCCSAYEGDWRETFLDGNRGNRSAVLDWNMEAMGPVIAGGGVGEVDSGDGESARRYFPPFLLCGYSFTLLADPSGNPRAADQAKAAGAARIMKGLSVYLRVFFPQELPDPPPWGGGFTFPHPFPPPPLQLDPEHIWQAQQVDAYDGGGDHADGEDIRVDAEWCSTERDEEGRAAIGGNGSGTSADGSSDDGGASAGSAAGGVGQAVVRRDPHGLRHRRRRFRRREGRAGTCNWSRVGDQAVIGRECCAAFSLSAINRGEGKDVTWVSSMEGDRFYPGRSSWGVHCLLPTSIMQDPQEGFLTPEGSLTVRLRVRLLFLILHIYTTADLAAHRGFGVVPLRGNVQPAQCYDHGRSASASQGQSDGLAHSSSFEEGIGGKGKANGEMEVQPQIDRPLPCLTFEVLQCTSLEELEKMVAQSLGISPTSLRLWVITQPLTDTPLAPRELLSARNPSFDNGQESPSLHRLLTGDMMDDTCRVRLWVEQWRDGGYWEAEPGQPQLNTPIILAHGRTMPRATDQKSFTGVRLVSWLELPLLDMPRSLVWGAAGGAVSNDYDQQVPGLAAALEYDTNPVIVSDEGEVVALIGSAADVDNNDDATSPETMDSCREEPERRILIFLKTFGSTDKNGCGPAATVAAVEGSNCSSDRDGAAGGGDLSGANGPRYLTHAILRQKSPLRALFELAADKIGSGVCAEDLEAYLEDLPCAWQDRVAEEQPAPAQSARKFFPHPQSRSRYPSSTSAPTSKVFLGGTSHNYSSCRHSVAVPRSETGTNTPIKSGSKYRRFFACPPPAGKTLCTASTGRKNVVPNSSSFLPVWPHSPGMTITNSDSTATASTTTTTTATATTTCTAELDAVASRSSTTENATHQDNGSRRNCLQKQQRHTERTSEITLENSGVLSGASICFFRKSSGDGKTADGKAALRRMYRGLTEGLVEQMRMLLKNEGPLGRVHHIKLPEVVEICESLGYQGFRARIAHDQQQHVNATETLGYVAKGRHLAFICDSCGKQDFCGPRFHCTRCPDYDLCQRCYNMAEPAPLHRYLFADGRWKREGGFHGHAPDHDLEEMIPVPAVACEWRRR